MAGFELSRPGPLVLSCHGLVWSAESADDGF